MIVEQAPETESLVVSEPQRIGVKVYVEDQETFDRARMIEVFHRWIQENRVSGTLIDVHDAAEADLHVAHQRLGALQLL